MVAKSIRVVTAVQVATICGVLYTAACASGDARAGTPVHTATVVVAYTQNGYIKIARLHSRPSGSLAATGTTTICRLPQGADPESLSISADGEWILTSLQAKDRSTVCAVQTRARAALRKLFPGDYPQFAPSGHEFAYTFCPPVDDCERWNSEARIGNLDLGGSRLLSTLSRSCSWSRDGKEIALVDESKHDFEAVVRIVDSASGRRTSFHREALNVHSPLLSPDGRFIAYSPHMSRPKMQGEVIDRSTGKVYTLPSAGEPVLDWSLDSRRLLWTRYEPDDENDGNFLWSEIWTSTPYGTRARKIGVGYGGRFTPDGRHIIFIRQRKSHSHEETGDLCLTDLKGGRVRVLARDVDSAFDVREPVTQLAKSDHSESSQGLKVVAPSGRNPVAQRSMSLPDKPGWTLTFHDEFDGTQLDKKKWLDSYPRGKRTHENNEQQYYATDGYEVKSGILRLKAEKRKMGGMPYTSGMISSFGKFSQKYGWFEIRARFPQGKGMWPAFWLLPVTDKWPPEIDILEILGHDPNKVYFSTHYRTAKSGHEYKTGFWVGPDFSKDFHTLALEWSPGECVWYVDGVERHRHSDGVPDEPMYILANLAVGGDWPGMPDAHTPFPSYMDIDYIRVYKKQPVASPGDSPPPPPVFKKP